MTGGKRMDEPDGRKGIKSLGRAPRQTLGLGVVLLQGGGF